MSDSLLLLAQLAAAYAGFALLAVVFTLAWRPRWLRVFTRVLFLSGRASRALPKKDYQTG